jgi:transcriptional regulator with XRE-family HTH domain
MAPLGKQAREYRLARRLKQKDVAAAMGIGASHLWDWEKGRRGFGLTKVFALTDVLNGQLMLGNEHVPNLTALGDMLMKRRCKAGLSQAQAAQRSGFSPGTIKVWEEGHLSNASSAAVERYAAFLASPLWLAFPTTEGDTKA